MSSGEDEIGPQIGEAVFESSGKEKAKLKKIPYESLYLDALPTANSYELSYMHRDVVTHVNMTKTEFLITASQDGHIKFWKKGELGIEFVKHIQAHLGAILDTSVINDGTLYATVSEDQTLKIFDVINFDMIMQFNLTDYIPITCEWISIANDICKAIAVSSHIKPFIYIYDAFGEPDAPPLYIYETLHLAPIINISFNHIYEVAISIDQKGMIEYWTGPKKEYRNPMDEAIHHNYHKSGDNKAPVIKFTHKLDTDLYELAKQVAENERVESARILKSREYQLATTFGEICNAILPRSCLTQCVCSSKLGFSPTGHFYALYTAFDEKVRIFHMDTGKLYRVYDESKNVIISNLNNSTNNNTLSNNNDAKTNETIHNTMSKRKHHHKSKKTKKIQNGNAKTNELSNSSSDEDISDNHEQTPDNTLSNSKTSNAGDSEPQITNTSISTLELNRRLALERELILGALEAVPNDNDNSTMMNYPSLLLYPRTCNVVWDESGMFIFYANMLGIRCLNVRTNRCARMFGVADNLRFLNLALFQGRAIASRYLENSIPDAISLEIEALTSDPNNPITLSSSANADIKFGNNSTNIPNAKSLAPDPVIFATGFRRNRFYLFTQREPKEDLSKGQERDVFNEKPSKEDMMAVSDILTAGSNLETEQNLATTAIIHTTMGDIHCKLFPKECPKTIQNFATHARNQYYNGHIFHRIIRGFMIQTGDPTGSGRGGESIWGHDFEDEISPNLKHDRPFMLSMANAGPNTNGSQFFITVVPCPWLDNKHTVFGIVTKGMAVVNKINGLNTNPDTDRPLKEVSILTITAK